MIPFVTYLDMFFPKREKPKAIVETPSGDLQAYVSEHIERKRREQQEHEAARLRAERKREEESERKFAPMRNILEAFRATYKNKFQFCITFDWAHKGNVYITIDTERFKFFCLGDKFACNLGTLKQSKKDKRFSYYVNYDRFASESPTEAFDWFIERLLELEREG